jgi:hypothetical protein
VRYPQELSLLGDAPVVEGIREYQRKTKSMVRGVRGPSASAQVTRSLKHTHGSPGSSTCSPGASR